MRDRQLDVLQLAALHRQEGRQERSTPSTAATCKYVEEINDNDEFYGKVRQQLQANQSIGRDIVTLTDYMAVKWVRNRYVEPLDKKNMPNVVKNLVDNLKSVPYDKKRDYTVPYQSGAIGLGLQPEEDGPRAEVGQRPLRPGLQGPRDDVLGAL